MVVYTIYCWQLARSQCMTCRDHMVVRDGVHECWYDCLETCLIKEKGINHKQNDATRTPLLGVDRETNRAMSTCTCTRDQTEITPPTFASLEHISIHKLVATRIHIRARAKHETHRQIISSANLGTRIRFQETQHSSHMQRLSTNSHSAVHETSPRTQSQLKTVSAAQTHTRHTRAHKRR